MGMIILPVGLRGAVSTHATHTPRSARSYSVFLSVSLSLSYTHTLSLSLAPLQVRLCFARLSLSFLRRGTSASSSFSPSSLAILQFHVLPYGNIVIFPRAVHFCAPPRALRSFRPIWIRAPRDLELEITQVRRHPDGCLRDLGRPASRSGIAARARYSRRDRERNSSSREASFAARMIGRDGTVFTM